MTVQKGPSKRGGDVNSSCKGGRGGAARAAGNGGGRGVFLWLCELGPGRGGHALARGGGAHSPFSSPAPDHPDLSQGGQFSLRSHVSSPLWAF